MADLRGDFDFGCFQLSKCAKSGSSISIATGVINEAFLNYISKTASDSPRDYRLHPQSMDRITGVFGEHVGKLFELMIADQMREPSMAERGAESWIASLRAIVDRERPLGRLM